MKMLNKNVCYVISKTFDDFGVSGEQYTIIEGVCKTEEKAKEVLEFITQNEYKRLLNDGEEPKLNNENENKHIITVGFIGGYQEIYKIHRTYNWD